ncbi:hypothetical protein AGLY_004796 [Aphis glycines]|uniref:Uncharacterized protein n=1 Tax=Aphis glycines TaxID=307491 RepID=A0A6G0TVA8_APHGL|nr:hypothetical protein AGLY_004796 [Aphis glycines]
MRLEGDASRTCGVSMKRFARCKSVDHVEGPSRLVVRYHVTGVPDQQHGERAVRGHVAGHFGDGALWRTVGPPDGSRRVPKLLGSCPPERPGHVHRAAIRHDRVQLSGVEEHAVPAGVQELGEPRGYGQWYVVLQTVVNHVHRRPRAPAHVQRSSSLTLHVPVPEAALVRYRVLVPHHVVDVPHAGQLPVQRRSGDHHLGHRVVRGPVIARGDSISGQVLLFFEQPFAVLCNDMNII